MYVCVYRGRVGDERGGGELYNDVPTGARCFEAVCLPGQWRNTFGTILVPKGSVRVRWGKAGRRRKRSEALSRSLTAPAGAPLPPFPPWKLQGRFSGANRKPPTFVRAVNIKCVL